MAVKFDILKPLPESCETCRFWKETTGTDNPPFGVLTALCKRVPPTIQKDSEGVAGSYFPRTLATNWCGEYKPR